MRKARRPEGNSERCRRPFESAGALLLAVSVMTLMAACSSPPSERPELRFVEDRVTEGGEKFANWPVPPEEIEDKVVAAMMAERYEVVTQARTATGITGAQEVTLYFDEVQKNIRFKWKPAAPGQLDQDNNSPRKEIAAYEVQKLFLDPEDYVVPTSLMYCAPAELYVVDGEKLPPAAPGANCILGNLSVWMQEVSQPTSIYQEFRFREDPNYAYFLSNFNLFTYLVRHQDGKASNFLQSNDYFRPQLYSIDNGISFGTLPYNFFVENWDVIRVAALRKESIDRLRGVRREDLDRLQVVAQLERNDEGNLLSVPPGESLDPDKGVVIADGTFQFGLSQAEIDALWERIQNVIAMVDSGEVPVF